MKLHTIETGYFKLDGGAMFGVVPKVIWNKINPADEHNLCTWAMRSLLIELDDKKILIDTGFGDKQPESFKRHYYLHGSDSLKKSLANVGVRPEQITDVFHTHLHFDHCGGTIDKTADGQLVPAFPNANLWCNEQHWHTAAVQPNAREKASFLRENILPMEATGRLKMAKNGEELFAGTGIIPYFVNGHTEAMMLLHIPYKGRTLVYMADLIPSAGHIKLPYVMAYDMQPLVTLQEKEYHLEQAVKNEHVLFFEHDPIIQCGTVRKNERGKYSLDKQGSLKNMFN